MMPKDKDKKKVSCGKGDRFLLEPQYSPPFKEGIPLTRVEVWQQLVPEAGIHSAQTLKRWEETLHKQQAAQEGKPCTALG